MLASSFVAISLTISASCENKHTGSLLTCHGWAPNTGLQTMTVAKDRYERIRSCIPKAAREHFMPHAATFAGILNANRKKPTALPVSVQQVRRNALVIRLHL